MEWSFDNGARWLTGISLLTGFLTASCTGVLTGEGGNGSAGTDVGEGSVDGSDPGDEQPGSTAHGHGWMPGKEADPLAVSRVNPALITAAQYELSLLVVFGEGHSGLMGVAENFPAETRSSSGFAAVAGISDVHINRYLDASEQVSGLLAPSLTSIMGCNIETAEEMSCIRLFAESVGEMLYRRPLTDADHDEFWTYYEHERDVIGRTPTEASQALLRLWLNSPYFLYRWELGHQSPEHDGEAVRLNPFQVASRLSYFLWSSGPDRLLMDAAESGQLSTEEQVAEQAARLLADPRAEHGVAAFIDGWLELSNINDLFKDPARFPQWNDDLRAALAEEVRTFTTRLVLEQRGNLNDLFSSPNAYVNEYSAPVYGIEGVTGAEMRVMPLPDPEQRAGLVTMPAVLASAADASVPNPFRLGKILLEKVFCEELEPPPDLPEFEKPESALMASERDYLEELTSSGGCASCHQRLNPLGLGLGQFDAIGAQRTIDEHGFEIDSSGTLLSGATFATPAVLGRILAEDEQVRACMTKQWFRYATDSLEAETDYASLEHAYRSFEGSEFTIFDLLIALTTSRSFLFRAPEEGETIP